MVSLLFYTSLYMPAASSLRTLSATSRTSTATVRVPMEISILSDLHIVAGLYHTSVDADTAVVTGLVCHGTTLDQTGYL